MTTLPERRMCIGCENLTRMTLDDGRAFCQNCCDKRNAIAQERKEGACVYCGKGTTHRANGAWVCILCMF